MGSCFDQKYSQWWAEQLEQKALVIVATPAKVSDALGGDARIASSGPMAAPIGLPVLDRTLADSAEWRNGAGKRGKQDWGSGRNVRARTESSNQHNVQDGVHLTNRRGVPLCRDYNEGTCTTTGRNVACGTNPNLIHLCNKCLHPHPGSTCSMTGATGPSLNARNRAETQAKGGKHGKQKGWGKGGKGGKSWWRPY